MRAAAGILFLLAGIVFSNAWFIGNYIPLKLFIIGFFIDFFIRLFINPRFSPTLILGRIMVSNQDVEFSGAPQKKFAWGLGFILSSIMLLLVVIQGAVGPINLLICLLCLTLLFFETAFGICLGCKLHGIFSKEKTQLCPGGTCKVKIKHEVQKVYPLQIFIVLLFISIIILLGLSNVLMKNTQQNKITECEVPQWAIDIGHEELYTLHHGCK